MLLSQYLNVEDLKREIDEGWVNVSKHPTLPLSLYSYSKQTVFEQHWTDITKKCRGLIVCNASTEIVARPFEKFFNINTEEFPETWFANLPDSQPLIQEKLDGSLGIFWKYGIHWGVASKGSLDSDHSRWATNWMERHVEAFGRFVWPIGYTPVFEIIAESIQHHVVSYSNIERLVLLALINIETGEEMPYYLVSYYAAINSLEDVTVRTQCPISTLLREDRENAEGYVVTYHRDNQPPLKLKIKHDTFLKYQRILHHASPKNVLELLRTGDFDTLSEWIDTTPAHVSRLVVSWKKAYTDEYQRIFNVCQKLMQEGLVKWTTRKEWAAWLLSDEYRKPYASVCFGILDQKITIPTIWKLVANNVHLTNSIDEENPDEG